MSELVLKRSFGIMYDEVKGLLTRLLVTIANNLGANVSIFQHDVMLTVIIRVIVGDFE